MACAVVGVAVCAAAVGPAGAEDAVPAAEAAWARGERDEAARLVRDYVQRHPESRRSPRVAALLARTADDPTEAVGRWDEVLALDPSGELAAEAHWHRGLHAYSAGLYVAAAQEFTTLADEFAKRFDVGRARLWTAYAELGADRPAAAFDLFAEAAASARDAADVRSAELGQAHAAFRLGRIGEALRRYESFERSHRGDGRASAAARRAVECLRLLGREADATRAATRIEREFPDSREATLARAEVRGAVQASEDEAAGGPLPTDAGREDEAPVGPFVVQAAAMTNPRNAAVLRRNIRDLHVGHVQVESGDGPDGPVHRVLVGPFETEAEARSAAEAIAALGDLNPRVRPVTIDR